jgi:hypothetical protein
MHPRKHHFVPSFYLSGFTQSGTEDGELHVIDVERKATWRSTPRNSAKEGDFYSLDDPATPDATAIEKSLARLEGMMAPVVQSIREDQLPNSPQEFEALMGFVAFMTVRTPSVRDFVNAITVEKIKEVMRDRMSTDQGLADFCAPAGVSETAEQEKLRDFANSDDYTLSVGNTWFVSRMWEAAIHLTPALLSRRWTIMTAETDESVLICSDSPVTILARDAAELRPPPGAWRPTTVLLPLDRRHVLVSDVRGPTRKVTLTAYDITRVNTNTMVRASQLYSGREHFLWQNRSGQVVDSKELIDLMKAASST